MHDIASSTVLFSSFWGSGIVGYPYADEAGSTCTVSTSTASHVHVASTSDSKNIFTECQLLCLL